VPTIPDHVLVFVLVVALPALGAKLGLERIRRRIRSGKPDPRVRAYAFSMLQQWTLAAACIAIWVSNERSWKDLGLAAPTGAGFWIIAVIAAAGVAFLLRQAHAVVRDPELQAQVRAKFGRTGDLIPRSPREAAVFHGLSLTAGVCEELLYRGFLTWYLSCYLPIAAAYLAAPCLFGLGHAYQGPKGILLTAMIGIVMSAMYLVGGSVWVPMAFHAFFDVHNGRLGRNAFASA
jgi:membrane protease YdiL (CAAX protease family)